MLHKLLLATIRYKKSDRILTSNLYRNGHWSALAKAKRDYNEYVREFCLMLPRYKSMTIHYTLYLPDKRRRDLDNFIMPSHKFLLDALTTNGVIEDDDVTIVSGFSAHYGGLSDDRSYYIMLEIEGVQDMPKDKDP